MEGKGAFGSYLGLICRVKRKNKRVGEFHRSGESEKWKVGVYYWVCRDWNLVSGLLWGQA